MADGTPDGCDAGGDEAEASGADRVRIARRAGVVAVGTLTSRILGAVRDAVIAACFALGATDAFFVAFTIPNALRVLLGEGAVSGAFVPVFSEVREREGEERAQRYFANLAGTMLVVLATVTLVGVASAPWLVALYAGGFLDEPDRYALTVSLARWVFPYIFFMGAAALCVGALNANKRFAVPAFSPALLNVSLIAAPFIFIPWLQNIDWPAVMALVIGALIGGVLQVSALIPALRSVGLFRRPRWGWSDPYVRKSFGLMVPLLAGVGVYQLNLVLSRLFASFLPEGALSYLYYSARLVEIPQGMFALAIATAALPTISDLRSRGQDERAREVFRYGLRLALFVAIPASVALFILAEPTIAALFGRGEFGPEQVAETVRALRWQAAGIWAVASVRTVVPLFHAYNDTRSPVVGSAVNLVVFCGASLALMPTLQHEGIALAISLAAMFQLVTLLVLLARRVGPLGLGQVWGSVGRVLIASLVMGGAVYGLSFNVDWAMAGREPLLLARYVGVVLAGGLIYLLAAKLLGASELVDMSAAIRRRVRRRS